MSNISIIGVSLLLILLALANPLGLWLPQALANLSIVMLVIAAIAFAFRAHDGKGSGDLEEKPAARSGYFAGVCVLVAGIAFITLSNDLANDPASLWLILALAGMVIARLIANRPTPGASASSGFPKIGIASWVALAALIVVLSGLAYTNIQPRAKVLAGRGKDVMLQGAKIVDQGTQVVQDGAALVEEGQMLSATSTPAQ